MNAFIISQCSYCPLVWMFYSRYNDGSPYLSFDELLIKDKSVTLHQKTLQFLPTKIFKVKNGMSTGLTENIFRFVDKSYNLRIKSILFRKRNKAVFYGTESPSSLGPKIWDLISQSQFKTKFKTWNTR